MSKRDDFINKPDLLISRRKVDVQQENNGICLYSAYHLICFSWLYSGLLLLPSDVKWTLCVKASTQCCLSQT